MNPEHVSDDIIATSVLECVPDALRTIERIVHSAKGAHLSLDELRSSFEIASVSGTPRLSNDGSSKSRTTP